MRLMSVMKSRCPSRLKLSRNRLLGYRLICGLLKNSPIMDTVVGFAATVLKPVKDADINCCTIKLM